MASISELEQDLQLSDSDSEIYTDDEGAWQVMLDISYKDIRTTDYDERYIAQSVFRHADHQAKIRQHARNLQLCHLEPDERLEDIITKMANYDIQSESDMNNFIETLRRGKIINMTSKLRVAHKFFKNFMVSAEELKHSNINFFLSQNVSDIITSEKDKATIARDLKLLDKNDKFIVLSFIPDLINMDDVQKTIGRLHRH